MNFFFAVQTVIATLLILVAATKPRTFERFFACVEGAFSKFSETRNLHLVFVFVFAIVIRLSLLPLLPHPPLLVSDEFSLLFQAKNMLQGKWALPTDPMWPHFVEMHMITTPTYASIYFPGRSLPMAIGLLLGNPWIGVLLTSAAMATAITWMLQAWLRPLSALMGGIVVVLHLGVFSYWVNGYWGGSITALGAALTLGAAGRLSQGARWNTGLWAGLGVLLMMTSRPFEGLLFCSGLGVALLPWAWRELGRGRIVNLARFVLPVLVSVGVGAAVIMSHSAAITGNPTKPAYVLGRSQYGGAPPFFFAANGLEQYWLDPHLKRLYRWEAEFYERGQSTSGYVKAVRQKFARLFQFFLGPILTIPFIFGIPALRRKAVMPLMAGGFVIAGFMATTWDFPHYVAPLLPCAALFIAAGLEHLRTVQFRGQPSGLFLARTVPAALLVSLLVPIGNLAFGKPSNVQNHWSAPCCAVARLSARDSVERTLAAKGGSHLVFVRYDELSGRLTWVYNEPDMDRARIVWARDLGDERNRALAARFPDRRSWVVYARELNPPLTEYKLKATSASE